MSDSEKPESFFKRAVKALTPKKKDRCSAAVKQARASLAESSEKLDELIEKLNRLEVSYVKAKR